MVSINRNRLANWPIQRFLENFIIYSRPSHFNFLSVNEYSKGSKYVFESIAAQMIRAEKVEFVLNFLRMQN